MHSIKSASNFRIIGVLLFAIAFFAFLGIGFMIGKDQSEPVAKLALPPEQLTLVIVTVDRLDSANPRLISVTAAFLKSGSAPAAAFKPLYPSLDAPEGAPDLGSSFTLTGDQVPAESFWSALEKYNFLWNGYLLLDTTGASTIAQWTGIPDPSSTSAQSATTPEQTKAISDRHTQYLNELCAQIQNRTVSDLPKPAWSSLVPAHMRTDLGFESFVSYWDLFANPEQVLSCSVINPAGE